MKKQTHKTKKEVAEEVKKKEEREVKLKFVKEVFYPALCAASTSIEDATQILSGFSTVIIQTVFTKVKDMTIKELELEKQLDPKGEKYKQHLKLLELFNDMKVFDAKKDIEGMSDEIALFSRQEREARKLSSLKTNWMK